MHNSDSNAHNHEPQKFERALKTLLKSTAGKLGQDFLHSLGEELCKTLPIDTTIIGRWLDDEKTKVQTVAVYNERKLHDNFVFELTGTFSESLLEHHNRCITHAAKQQFPRDLTLLELQAEGCLGVTLNDSSHEVIGFLIALTTRPLTDISLLNSVLQVFSFRVAAELERQSINQNLRNEVIINQTQLDSVPALMFMLDKEGRFLRWNQYFSSKFGYSHREMLEEHIWMAIHETDRKRIELEIAQIFKDGHGAVYVNGITRDGDIVPMLATAEAAVYKNEPVIVGVALDMTEQQNVERNLLRSQGRLARRNSQLSLMNTLIEKLHASYSIQNIANEVVKVMRQIQRNSAIDFSILDKPNNTMEVIASAGIGESMLAERQTIALSEAGSPNGIALASRQLEVFPIIRDEGRINAHLQQLMIQEGIKGGLVIPLIYQDEILGSISIWYKYKSEFLQDELEFYQTIGSSISLALANARQFNLMQDLATRDNLTGLPNRNALNQDCEAELRRLKYTDTFVGLILVDLDRFKEINDTLDHQIGDKLLKLIGPRLTTELEEHDCNIYRLGGDEFCVLVTNKQNFSQFDEVAELTNQAIAKPFEVDGLNLEINSSLGVATTQGIRHSSSEMLRCAELAMYHAKTGGGGIAIYTPELDADTDQRFVIMAEMAEAIRNDELILHYQPKFDIKLGRIIGCEALVRWQHKRYGLLPPTKFIPLVELTQLIRPLTYWVMRTAMAQVSAWKKQGIEISMAINLSTRNLTDDDFMAQVDALFEEFDIDPGEIEFEVTETALMNNLERAKQQLLEFSQRGIHCSLDDYGTGYSSLSYIKKLPLDILKIDRSFISRMLENNEDRIIARSTINLAHSLGLKVVAEGVENEFTLKELSAQDCDFIQGYYISEPLDAESFATLYWEHSL